MIVNQNGEYRLIRLFRVLSKLDLAGGDLYIEAANIRGLFKTSVRTN